MRKRGAPNGSKPARARTLTPGLVGLELLRSREARDREARAVAHQAASSGLFSTFAVTCARRAERPRARCAGGMAQGHVRDLVREHRRDLGGVVGERQQPAGHVEAAVRQREGVDHRGVEDRDLIGLVGRSVAATRRPVTSARRRCAAGARTSPPKAATRRAWSFLAADGAGRRRRQGRRAVEEPAAGQAEDGRHGRRHPARADPVRSPSSAHYPRPLTSTSAPPLPPSVRETRAAPESRTLPVLSCVQDRRPSSRISISSGSVRVRAGPCLSSRTPRIRTRRPVNRAAVRPPLGHPGSRSAWES